MEAPANQSRLQKEWFQHKLAAVKSKAEVADKLKSGTQDFVLLDSRDRAAYDKDHLPGALPMPLAEVAQLAADLDPQREYVVYCEYGLKSAHLAEQMREAGLLAHHFRGGTRALRRAVGDAPAR